MSDDEMTQANFELSKEIKEKAKANTKFGGWSDGLREAAREMALGEPMSKAQSKNELSREQWEATETGVEDVLSELDKESSSGGAITIATVREKLEAFTRERGNTVAEQNSERIQQARNVNRAVDPESTTLGAEKSPAEAARALFDGGEHGNWGIASRIVKEGPDNPAIEAEARRCAMDPEDFYEFLLDEMADEPVGDSGGKTVAEFVEASRNLDRPHSAATDGGERR